MADPTYCDVTNWNEMFRRGHVKLLALYFTTDVEYPDEGRHIVPDMMKRYLKKEDRCRALLVRIKTCYEVSSSGGALCPNFGSSRLIERQMPLCTG